MKRVILSVFITVFAILLSFFSGRFVEEKILTLEEDFNGCYKSLTKDNITYAEEELKDIVSYWDKSKTYISLFINGEICNDLEDEMKKLELFLQNKNTVSAMESTGECLNLLLAIKEKERLSADSVL